MKNTVKGNIILSLSILISSLGITLIWNNPVIALSGSDFKANRIIDDNLFYNGSTLSTDQIQQFLNAKMPKCDTNGEVMFNSTQTRAQWAKANSKPLPPYICLKDFKQDHAAKSDSGICSYIPDRTSRTAAQIIDEVARACNISQKTLLVLLQKEQSLITDDWPWPVQYEKATGYYCPDDPNNPGWCHPDYAGFFNQVYNAAKQFNRYRLYPDEWNHAQNKTSFVAYQANMSSCGGTNLTMQTAATAGLYNYTPYQPNAAALNNLYGTGDSCSAYGNRNFWRMYNDWFGSTMGTPFFHVGSGEQIYTLGVNNNYYYVSDWETMNAYGWGKGIKKVARYSEKYLDGKTYSGKLNVLARFENDKIYLVDNGQIHHFPNSTMLNNFGHAIGDESSLPYSTSIYLKPSSSMTYSVQNIENKARFLVGNSEIRHFISPSSYTSGDPAYSSRGYVVLSNDYLTKFKFGAPIYASGTLMRVDSKNPLYLINNVQEKIYIPNQNILKEYNYSSNNYVSNNSYQATWHPTANKSLGYFVKDTGTTIYMINQKGIKRVVSQEVAGETKFNITTSSLVSLEKDLLRKFKTGDPLTNVLRADGDDKVYVIENGTKTYMTSPSALYQAGYTFEDVTNVSENFLNSLQ